MRHLRRWNRADKVLLVAFVFFVISLLLRGRFPESRFFSLLLFVAEAAFVGGAADWFAVTALFENPFGRVRLPFLSEHTAILPRRRQEFISSCASMVQNEFFSRHRLIGMVRSKLDRQDVRKLLLSRRAREFFAGELWNFFREFVSRTDLERCSEEIFARVSDFSKKIPPERFSRGVMEFLRQDGRDAYLLSLAAAGFREKIAGDGTRRRIEAALEKFRAEKTGGMLGGFLLMLARGTGIVNIPEAAIKIQRVMLEMTGEAATPGSPLQEKLLAVFYGKAALLDKNESFAGLCEKLRGQMIDDSGLKTEIRRRLELAVSRLLSEEHSLVAVGSEAVSLKGIFEEIAGTVLQNAADILQQDEEMIKLTDGLLYDVAARSVLKARELSGGIVSSVLRRMSDEKLNSLIYDKTEEDLLWIRMNGSIVGAIVGVGMFFVMSLFRG